MRKEYELTLSDYMHLSDTIGAKDHIFPTKFNGLMLGWIELGEKYKFNPYTVQQLDGSYYKFTAESLEND